MLRRGEGSATAAAVVAAASTEGFRGRAECAERVEGG